MMWGYGPGSGLMGWGYGSFGLLHMMFWIIILGAIIAAVAWFARSTTPPDMHQPDPRQSASLDVLKERYARGEMNRDEYLQKKQDISA